MVPTEYDLNRLFDTVLEAVEVETGHALHRITSDWNWRFVDGSRDLVQRTRVLPSGDIAVDVFRFTLVRND